MEKIVKYKCNACGKIHNSERSALECEKRPIIKHFDYGTKYILNRAIRIYSIEQRHNYSIKSLQFERNFNPGVLTTWTLSLIYNHRRINLCFCRQENGNRSNKRKL